MKVVPLRHAAELVLGRQRAPEYEHGDGQTRYLRSANIRDGRVDLSDVKSMRFSRIERLQFGLQPGDVLVTEGSGSRDTVGASAVWMGELDGPVCFQNTLLRLRPRAGVSGRYLAWWARHAHASGQVAAVATGANILHIGAEAMGALPVAVPALDDQRRIANFLDEEVARLDTAARAAAAVVNVAGDRREAALAELIDPRDPQMSLRRMLSDACVGVVVEPSQYFRDDGVPFVHGYNVRDGWLDLTNLKFMSLQDSRTLRRSMLRGGEVLVVRAGEPGRAAAVTDDVIGGNCASVLVLRPDPVRLLPAYLVALLNGPSGRAQVRAAQYGAAQGVVNLADLRGFVFRVPRVGDQRKRLELLDERLTYVQEVQVQGRLMFALLEERKRALITACVTGHFDVSAASDRAGGAALAH
jgi:type I restriction enzyme S subunit